MGLYKISADLQAIFNEIEENGGEVTDELIEKLQIGEEELKDKLNNYVQIISNLQSDVDQCSAEIKRIQEIKKSKDNLIKRLKSAILEAVNKFGDINKSGSRFIDLGTCKVSTRKSISTETYDDYVSNLGTVAINYIKRLRDNKMLLGSDPHRDRDFIDDNKLTDYDLYPMNLEINIKVSALSVVRGVYDTQLKDLLDENFNQHISVTANVDKTQAKELMQNGNPLTIAKLNNNQSLTIK